MKRNRGRPLGSVDRRGRARRVPVPHRSMRAWRTIARAFGERLRALREEQDIAAVELAAALGCSKGAVWAWERGEKFPGVPALLSVAAALDCSLVDLMPDEAHHRASPSRGSP